MHDELIELSDRLLRAIPARDRDALDDILSDDFQHFDGAGAAVGTHAFTSAVLEAPFEVLSIGRPANTHLARCVHRHLHPGG